MLRAAEQALIVNATHGDGLRDQLAQRVRYFRTRLGELALSAEGGLFPVQTLRLTTADAASTCMTDCATTASRRCCIAIAAAAVRA